MKYREMTKNYIFRELQCGLSVKDTADLCFKSVRTVKGWDEGNTIPPECKRLMRLNRGLSLSHLDQWKGFKMSGDKLQLPTGQYVSAQQILTGVALLEIASPHDLKTLSKLMKYARAISSLR